MIENAFVCYFDVLGFTSRIISGDLSSRYEGLIDMVKSIHDPAVTMFLMSDSIIVVSEDFDKFRSMTKEFYTWGILNDFWLRGAIARGNVTEYEERTITEKNRFILPFLGQGYLRAYVLETTLNISGVQIDPAFFETEGANPGFRQGIDYIEYEEYLPKLGYEGKKCLLLPKEHNMRQVVDTMYFEAMLKSHVEDVDKYINTFCFYVRYLMEHARPENLIAFLDRLMGEFEAQGRRILIPSKVVTIFIAVIEGLLIRYRSHEETRSCDPVQVGTLISRIISGLKDQGYISAFVDNLLEFDKKRRTSLYKEINSLRSSTGT
jgi:hypothetical protein